CFSLLPNISSFPPGEAYLKAKAAAMRALELADVADAHFALAWTLAAYEWNWAEAEREFRLGLDVNSNSPTGHARFGWFLSWLGRQPEAVREIKKALALTSGGVTEIEQASAVYLVGRDYDQAIIEAKRAIAIDPTYVFGHNRLGTAYLEKKMYTEAIETFER